MRAKGFLIALALLMTALPMAAQSYDWSAVGSVGIIVTGNGHSYTGPTFTFATTRWGTQTARYPVTNTYGSSSSKSPAWTTLWASYTDNSTTGSVTTTLYEVDKCSNTQTQICQIVSSNGTTDPQCSSCTFGSGTFDFANNTYYVEVKLQRSSTTPVEQLHSIGIQ